MAAADGYGGGEEQYMYHVPQQSRREKLRFHESSYLPNPNDQFFPTNNSNSSSNNNNNNNNRNNNNNNSFCYATTASGLLAHHHQISNQHHQQQQQRFSLSLSTAPPPRQYQHQHQQLMSTEGNKLKIPAPLGPFTGYAEILNRSRFLEPARQLLEEICNVGGVVDLSADRAAEAMTAGGGAGVGPGGVMGEQQQWKKTRLISMLDEVCRRYKLYYQQVQAVIASFESVPGLGSAAPYASMALKVLSNHFRYLKNAISDQLHQINKAIGKEGFSEEENPGYGLINRAANNYGTFGQPHVWRPQRGLPERAVAVLRAWLFEHFLHPYPTDTDKQMLAKQTGLTRNQVSNWFINARVRLWKPMVEEIHSLELRQQNKAGAGIPNNTADKLVQLPSSSAATSSNDPPFQNGNQNNQNQSSKRPHNELMQMHNHLRQPNYSLVYDGFPGHHNIGVGGGVDGKGNGGVSLTLGLHQNNGMCSTDPIPLNVVRRLGLGLEECSDPYVIGSFGGQDRHFEKDIGGRLLRDFVG